MLVFSRTQDKDHPEEIHPIIRFIERGGGLNIEQFVRIVADINEYLPVDWRMTNERQNFRILVSINSTLFAIDGQSFRYSNGIIHIINTVLTPEMVKQGEKDPDSKRQPNLYYLIPRPDYSSSNLFARQFEKIKVDGDVKSITQYHKIHPLTKSGIDPDHFHWVKWDADSGVIETVAYPATDYHGKNYWTLTELSKATGRCPHVRPYLIKYKEIIAKYLSIDTKPPEPPPSSYELECKLWRQTMSNKALEKLISACREALLSLNMGIMAETAPFSHKDIYFDDSNFSLFHAGISFRLREKNDYVQITLKARPKNTTTEEEIKWYRRLEEEAPISMEQQESLKQGVRISALPCRLISYLAPHCGPLVITAKIVTNRVSITINNRQNQQAEIHLDHVIFNNANDRRTGSDVEIEIESKGMMRDEIEIVAELLSGLDKQLIFSSASKYDRAVKYLQSEKGNHETVTH